MLNAFRLYFRYLGVSVRAQMQYRASFALLTFSQFFVTGIEFLAIWALFARFGSLRGWTLPEVALFYGMINVSFALGEAAGRGFDTFAELVKSGDFDRVLLRPRGTAFQIAAQDLQLMRVGRLIQGVLVLGWALSRLHVTWSLSHFALLLFAILGGAALFYGLFVLQATLAFWTIDSLEVVNTVTYGGVETAQYPVTIYRPWFRQLFTWVIPLACANYFPAHALLGRTEPLGTTLFWQRAAPAVGFLFLLGSLQLWTLGVRHYHSTGS